MDPGPLLERTAQLLFEPSLFNAHPRFFGYVTAPTGQSTQCRTFRTIDQRGCRGELSRPRTQ